MSEDERDTMERLPIPCTEGEQHNQADCCPYSRVLHMITFDTMPEQQKLNLLFHILFESQQERDEMKQRLNDNIEENHKYVTENYKLRQEVAALKAQIGVLQTKLCTQVSENQSAVLHSGAKRGRFHIAKASVIECCHCHGVFSSVEVAHNSLCAHHTRPATELPNKMMGKIHKTSSKLRYWPCCQKISTDIPSPCFHGSHELKHL